MYIKEIELLVEFLFLESLDNSNIVIRLLLLFSSIEEEVEEVFNTSKDLDKDS